MVWNKIFEICVLYNLEAIWTFGKPILLQSENKIALLKINILVNTVRIIKILLIHTSLHIRFDAVIWRIHAVKISMFQIT